MRRHQIVSVQMFNLFLISDTTDTDYSESEAFSSLQISGQIKSPPMSPPSHSEGMVMRIETARAPVPSQPEIVMSDGESSLYFILLKKTNTKTDPTTLLAFYELSVFSFLLFYSNLYFYPFPCFDGFVQLWRQVVEAHLCPSNRIFPQNVINLSFKNMKAFTVSLPLIST